MGHPVPPAPERAGTCHCGKPTHCICAATGLCPGLLELFLAQDRVPDEDREGTGQLLIQFSHTVLATQRELGLLRGDPKARLDELDGSMVGGRVVAVERDQDLWRLTKKQEG